MVQRPVLMRQLWGEKEDRMKMPRAPPRRRNLRKHWQMRMQVGRKVGQAEKMGKAERAGRAEG